MTSSRETAPKIDITTSSSPNSITDTQVEFKFGLLEDQVKGRIHEACLTPRKEHWSLWIKSEDSSQTWYVEAALNTEFRRHHLDVYHCHTLTEKDRGKPWDADKTTRPKASEENVDVEYFSPQDLAKIEHHCFEMASTSRTMRYVLGFDQKPEGTFPDKHFKSDFITPEISRNALDGTIDLVNKADVESPKVRRRSGNLTWFQDDGFAASDPWLAFEKTPGSIFTDDQNEILAHIQHHPEGYIVNLVDCVSEFCPHNDTLAQRIFKSYPDANIYSQRRKSKQADTPGKVLRCGQVLNLCCTYQAGLVNEYMENSKFSDQDVIDSVSNRLKWFGQCLVSMANLISESHGNEDVFVGLPGSIGEREHQQPAYMAALYTFARDNPNLKLVIYEKSNITLYV